MLNTEKAIQLLSKLHNFFALKEEDRGYICSIVAQASPEFIYKLPCPYDTAKSLALKYEKAETSRKQSIGGSLVTSPLSISGVRVEELFNPHYELDSLTKIAKEFKRDAKDNVIDGFILAEYICGEIRYLFRYAQTDAKSRYYEATPANSIVPMSAVNFATYQSSLKRVSGLPWFDKGALAYAFEKEGRVFAVIPYFVQTVNETMTEDEKAFVRVLFQANNK